MADVTRVVLCDDHPIMRGGLRRLLDAEDDIEILGEAREASHVVTLTRALRPDVVIIDIGLPGENGIEATRKITEEQPDTRILILTMHAEIEYVRAAFEAGAIGYLVKEAAESEFLLAVRTVAQGRRYVYATLGGALIAEATGSASKATPHDNLSDRERNVLRCVAQGYTNAETAVRLNLSVRTVETHRARIQQKLGIKSRAALTRAAREAGLLGE